jgi:hypothetical protein
MEGRLLHRRYEKAEGEGNAGARQELTHLAAAPVVSKMKEGSLSFGNFTMSSTEPRNPFYILLLLVGLLFIITTMAVAVVPVLEKKAAEAGATPPPSEFRDYLRTDGWQVLLWQVGALIVLAILSMGLDRLRRLQNERPEATIPPSEPRT